jgi:DNA-binding NarL/FixJ family response regulator
MNDVVNSIAIVEDIAVIRTSIAAALVSDGAFHQVYSFDSGESILADIQNIEPPQIVLMDIGLPGINGLETMKKLLDKWPISKVLIFTIYADHDHVFEAIKSGASGYILKSESTQNIIASIKEILNGGAPMSREIAKKILQSFHTKENNVVTILTPREYQILQLLSSGHINKEIADQLDLSLSTVKNHLQNIYTKLHVQNRSEALLKYFNK